METNFNDNAKLHSFARYVMNDAQKQRDKLEAELKQKWNAALSKTESEIYEQSYNKIQKRRMELVREANEAISRQKLECKRALSSRRSELTAAVMDDAAKSLADFVKSERYYPWLLKTSKEAIESLGDGNIVLYLNYTDDANRIQLSTDTGCEVVLLDRGADIIGGVKAVNTDLHIAVNKTLSLMLSEQESEFLHLSKLSL